MATKIIPVSDLRRKTSDVIKAAQDEGKVQIDYSSRHCVFHSSLRFRQCASQIRVQRL